MAKRRFINRIIYKNLPYTQYYLSLGVSRTSRARFPPFLSEGRACKHVLGLPFRSVRITRTFGWIGLLTSTSVAYHSLFVRFGLQVTRFDDFFVLSPDSFLRPLLTMGSLNLTQCSQIIEGNRSLGHSFPSISLLLRIFPSSGALLGNC